MKTFKEYTQAKSIPFDVRVAQKIVEKIIKKHRLTNTVSITAVNERVELIFSSPCSEKMGQKIQAELESAGLTPVLIN